MRYLAIALVLVGCAHPETMSEVSTPPPPPRHAHVAPAHRVTPPSNSTAAPEHVPQDPPAADTKPLFTCDRGQRIAAAQTDVLERVQRMKETAPTGRWLLAHCKQNAAGTRLLDICDNSKRPTYVTQESVDAFTDVANEGSEVLRSWHSMCGDDLERQLYATYGDNAAMKRILELKP
jgi:hypothetical protein